MRRSVFVQKQLRDTIREDVQKRTLEHQARIRNLRVGFSNMSAFGASAPTRPLVLLSHGDSWFDYPLTGNGLPVSNTDIIAQLEGMGTINPVILNLSHHGDATTDEMSLPKQQRLIEALNDPENWLDRGKPDAILFSGGGNDIAGTQFCIFLDYATKNSTGLNPVRFGGALAMVEASYRDLFLFRDHYAPGVPIFAHDYDLPIPNGKHPICAGPWLQPSLRYAGWTSIAQGEGIVGEALKLFSGMLGRLAQEPQNNFTLVSTQRTLKPEEWANELHPFPGGFHKLAQKYIEALRAKFPGQI